jgi:hypothetical protein
MEPRTIWIARNKDGKLNAFTDKPIRTKDNFLTVEGCTDVFDEDYSDIGVKGIVQLPKKFYPEVTWENSPVELLANIDLF